MYLVFLDGSGNTGLNLTHPTSTTYLLMGLAVHGNRIRALEDEMGAVHGSHFGPASHAPDFECKGSDLYRGPGSLRGHGARRAHRALRRAGPAPRPPWRAADLGGDRQPRLAARYREPIHPHKLAFIFMAEQVESFLQGQREFGLIASDEEDVEQQPVEDLRRYKEAGTPFVREPLGLRRIADNVRGG